jgi:hypothetical protein
LFLSHSVSHRRNLLTFEAAIARLCSVAASGNSFRPLQHQRCSKLPLLVNCSCERMSCEYSTTSSPYPCRAQQNLRFTCLANILSFVIPSDSAISLRAVPTARFILAVSIVMCSHPAEASKKSARQSSTVPSSSSLSSSAVCKTSSRVCTAASWSFVMTCYARMRDNGHSIQDACRIRGMNAKRGQIMMLGSGVVPLVGRFIGHFL